jgi:uncharacterized protein YaeQ
MDRHYYAEHSMTLARHPSETDERMMLRLLAFAIYANDQLELARGLSADDEPDLWIKNYVDEIELWIDLGLPSDKRIRKACGRAKQVKLVCYGSEQAVAPWLHTIRNEVSRHKNLEIVRIPSEQSTALALLAERTMHLQVNIQDGHIWISSEAGAVMIELHSTAH